MNSNEFKKFSMKLEQRHRVFSFRIIAIFNEHKFARKRLLLVKYRITVTEAMSVENILIRGYNWMQMFNLLSQNINEKIKNCNTLDIYVEYT